MPKLFLHTLATHSPTAANPARKQPNDQAPPPLTEKTSHRPNPGDNALGQALACRALSIGSRPVHDSQTGAIHAIEFFILDNNPEQPALLDFAELEKSCSPVLLYSLFSWYLQEGLAWFLELNAHLPTPAHHVYFHTTASLFFHPHLLKALTSFPIDPYQPGLLLPEEQAISNPHHFSDRARLLESAGIKTGLENFTGSLVSLGKLALLPIHTLVVDCTRPTFFSPVPFQTHAEKLLKITSLLDMQVIFSGICPADVQGLKTPRRCFYQPPAKNAYALSVSLAGR